MKSKMLVLMMAMFLTLGFARGSQALVGEVIDTVETVLHGGEDPTPAVPEPSAALIFGTGLLVAGLAHRRRSR